MASLPQALFMYCYSACLCETVSGNRCSFRAKEILRAAVITDPEPGLPSRTALFEPGFQTTLSPVFPPLLAGHLIGNTQTEGLTGLDRPAHTLEITGLRAGHAGFGHTRHNYHLGHTG